MEITTIYLSLGSNLGDRFNYLNSAIDQIKKTIGSVISSSSMFETPPLGFEADTSFINCVVSIETIHSPKKVLQLTQKIEQELGRRQKTLVAYQSRVIDIDIILFGNYCINTPELFLPHKEYINRRFVLVPLAEIAPKLIDPTTHLTVKQLLLNCLDNSEIKLIP